jgi:hypothetical protein
MSLFLKEIYSFETLDIITFLLVLIKKLFLMIVLDMWMAIKLGSSTSHGALNHIPSILIASALKNRTNSHISALILVFPTYH